MKIRIGNLEVTDVTPDELDDLVKRYGGDATKPAAKDPIQAYVKDIQEAGAAIGAADTVLLKKLVDAGAIGMTTGDIGTILGKRGKAAKKALDVWAGRVGLPMAENADAFEFARVGTRRGWRLKESLLDVARHILSQRT